MNELHRRLIKCTGRFLYRTTGSPIHSSWKDRQIYFVDPSTNHIGEVTPQIRHAGTNFATPFGWDELLAFILCMNGYTIAKGYSNTDGIIANWYDMTGVGHIGAQRITYKPGQEIRWWGSGGVQASYGEYIYYTFPTNLDSIIRSDGVVVDPAALLFLLAAMVELPGRVQSVPPSLDGADVPLIGFQGTGTGDNWSIRLLRAAYSTSDASHLTWFAATSPSANRQLVAVLNSMFPCDACSVTSSNQGVFEYYNSCGLLVPQIAQKDVDDVTRSVAGSEQRRCGFAYTVDNGTPILDAANSIWSACRFDPERYPYASDSVVIDGIASGVLALQETLATVQGGVSDANSGIGGISDQVGNVAADVEAAKQAILTAIDDVDVDLSPIQAQIEQVFAQASVDAQIVAAMAIKVAIGKLPKKLRTALLNALRNMRYDQGALPEYAGQYGGAINLYDMLFDSNGKPIFTQEAPDGSDTQH